MNRIEGFYGGRRLPPNCDPVAPARVMAAVHVLRAIAVDERHRPIGPGAGKDGSTLDPVLGYRRRERGGGARVLRQR